MKRLLTYCLVLVMALSCLILPAQASDLETVQGTVQTLGIMIGDENGNMDLESNVTRAQFAKMMVMASPYKDTVAESSNYSLFKDVKRGHWATEYIRVAVEQGWVTGYSDGTYRPEQTIKTEEAASALLKMLGYAASDLAGSYPEAHLNKFSALGLGDSLSLARGKLLTRWDCMYIFYNLMTAATKSGSAYAVTLGYSLTAGGQLDYAKLVSGELKGPYTADSGTLALSFTPVTVYKNGRPSSIKDVDAYDIYYYNANAKAVYLYNNRVTGTYTAATPSTVGPTAVTVAGGSYQLGTSAAAYKLSAMGPYAIGDTVTLLLGMDGTVADVVEADRISAVYYGVVISNGSESYTTEGGAIEAGHIAKIHCTDGTARTFPTTYNLTEGDLVSVSYASGKTTVTTLSSKNLTGFVNTAGTKLGDTAFADGVEILDTDKDGNCLRIYPSRLAGSSLDSDDVRWYATDNSGKITHIILNDATGDLYSYGLLTNVVEVSAGMNLSASYSYLINGTAGMHNPSGTLYGVKEGGARFHYVNGQIDNIKNLASASVTEIRNNRLTADGRTLNISEHVQVYRMVNGQYVISNLAAVGNTDAYRLVAWYDHLNTSAGSRVRIITAFPK